MASRFRGRAGAALPPPPPCHSRGGLELPVLVVDPALDSLDRLGVTVDGAEVVEEAPLQRARRERHKDLALGTPPQAEADQPGAGEGALFEVDLGLAHESLRRALTLHEQDPHRSPPPDSMSRMRRSDCRGASAASSRECPENDLLRRPPLARSRGEEKDSATTAEGSPHIRGDGGVGGASSRDSRSGAKEPRRGWRARAASQEAEESG